MEKDLQQQITVLKEQLDKLSTDKQSTESRLTGDLDALHRRLLGKNRPQCFNVFSCSAHMCIKFAQAINFSMPTIVGILVFDQYK